MGITLAVGLVAIVAGLALALTRRMRLVAPGRIPAAFTRASAAEIASGGWRRSSFLVEGLDDGSEALDAVTDEAEMHGYHREPGEEPTSWRFVRGGSS